MAGGKQMSVRINGQEMPATINEIKINGGHVELDGAHICCTDKIEIDIETEVGHLSPILREYVEKSMRANEP
jgi:hypothetical protein